VGTLYGGVREGIGAAKLTYIALEFGTRSIPEVLTALRADHWLHAVKNRETPLRAAISRQVRDAFYIDTPVVESGDLRARADLIVRAARCLSA
jgi:hypothetical protein